MKVWNYLTFLSKVQTPESLPYQEEYSIIHFNLISSPFSLIFSSPSVLDKTSISKINKYIPLKTKFQRNQYLLLLKYKIKKQKKTQSIFSKEIIRISDSNASLMTYSNPTIFFFNSLSFPWFKLFLHSPPKKRKDLSNFNLKILLIQLTIKFVIEFKPWENCTFFVAGRHLFWFWTVYPNWRCTMIETK